MARSAQLLQPLSIQERLKQIGLVDYWPLDEASGNARSALYGPALHDGADVNAVTQAAGPSNNIPSARQFTAASSQYFNCGTNYPIPLRSSIWISCWAYADSLGANRSIVTKFDTNSQRAMSLSFDNGTNRFRILQDADGTGVTALAFGSLGAPSVTTWYFLNAWYDIGSNRLFARANLGATDTAAGESGWFQSTAALAIGTRFASGVAGEFWNGRIAQMMIHQRIPASGEIFWLYNNGQGRSLMRSA